MIKEHIGENAITMDDGEIVYQFLYDELSKEQLTELDFEGVEIVASPFLNVAIGKLMRDFTPEQLNNYLKFKNVSPITVPILRRVIETSRRYYTDNNYQMAVNTVIEKESSGDNDF